MPWESIKYVSSGLTLIAFIVATVAWVIKYHTQEKRRLIEVANDERKAKLVNKALDLVDVDTAKLNEEQRYNLAMKLIEKRSEKYKIIAIVVCVLAIIGSFVAIYSKVRTLNNVSSLEPLIRECHKLQAVAAAMSDGPLEKVREVYSRAPMLAEDILSVSNLTNASQKIDQNRYAATAYLFASDSAKDHEEQERYAKRAIDLVKQGLELIYTTKANDAGLSLKLTKLKYIEKLRHIQLEAFLTLAIIANGTYQNSYKSIANNFDCEYFRINIGYDYESQKKTRLKAIHDLWEGNK